jgi:sugar phosphate isomerase/epimerase
VQGSETEVTRHQPLTPPAVPRPRRRDRLDERVIWVYVIQIMEALAVLHEVNVLHRGGGNDSWPGAAYNMCILSDEGRTQMCSVM